MAIEATQVTPAESSALVPGYFCRLAAATYRLLLFSFFLV
jgi:hypothetical protein